MPETKLLDIPPCRTKNELADAIKAHGFVFSRAAMYNGRHKGKGMILDQGGNMWRPDLDYIREHIKVRATGKTVAEMEEEESLGNDNAAKRKAIAEAKIFEHKARAAERAELRELGLLVDRAEADRRHVLALVILQNKLNAAFDSEASNLITRCQGDTTIAPEIRSMCKDIVAHIYHELFAVGGEMEIKGNE